MEQVNGTAVESPAVVAARARVEAMRAKSNKLPREQELLAKLAEEEIEQERRLEREGEETLRQLACLCETEAKAALPAERQERDTILSIRDYPTHRRTGRGLIVVRALERAVAISTMKPANKVGAAGINLFDSTPEAVVKGLVNAALYPDAGTIQMICEESPAFALAAYSQAVQLSGAFALVTTGKSGS